MTLISSVLRISFLMLAGALLVACKDDTAASIGFWKADDRNFIEIAQTDGSYSATVYRPSSWDSTFEKVEYPASYADGAVSIDTPGRTIPVLHKPDEDVIVVFGDVEYARVDAESTRFEVEGMLQQAALDVSQCEDLQSQINAVRGTFENNDACRAFMTPVLEQKPDSCDLLFTSCNSF